MREIRFILLAILLVFGCASWGQTSNHQLQLLEKDIKIYGNAVKKIISNDKCQEGIDDLTALIARYEQHPEYDKVRLGVYYRDRAVGYKKMKQYQEATKGYTKAIDLFTQAGQGGQKELSDTWYQLALLYYDTGQKAETMDAVTSNLQTSLDYYGPQHTNTLNAYSLRANLAGMYGQRERALADRLSCFEIVRQNVERNFAYLTQAERAAYWQEYMPQTTIMFAFAHKLEVKADEYADALYDQQLLAKGLLITAESSLQRTIDNNADLASTYKQIRLLRKKALEDKSDLKKQTEANLKADQLERQLTASANGIGQFMSLLRIHNEDVKQQLRPQDVAIEFVDYRVGKDSTMYAALIISPSWQHVRFVPLAEQHEIEQHKDNLSPIVWQPIISELDTTVSNIYFAPSGLLYQIPIESHRLDDNTLIGEAYNIYRMSSTRWLAHKQQEHVGHDAALFGDLQYDTTVQELAEDMKRYPTSPTRSGLSPKLRGASSVLGLTPLPQTRDELTSIIQILSSPTQATMNVKTYTGNMGTETAFKALSGSKTKVIHIATHGFFDNTATTDADALQGSGLYFAGADNTLQGESIPVTVNDGILTAEEAAQMDLTGLDMLCLSACETGLGNVTADGVFGLQRGFKKAGANTILMSLWKVNDAATCKLMTTFYDNWIGKQMTKHDALEAAKRTLREMARWQDPKYWAAFILLDGID